MFTPTDERHVPWSEDWTTDYEHMHRYTLAMELASGKSILDLASGEGYGSWHLAQKAKNVTGVDIDEFIIHHAQQKYKQTNLQFLRGSITQVPIEGKQQFDMITCFEALEHIVEHDELMAEVSRLIKEDGIFLVSTPNKPVYSNNGLTQNPYHLRELELDEFKILLGKHFKYVEIYGQKTYAASHLFKLDSPSKTLRSYRMNRSNFAAKLTDSPEAFPRYFIALASNNPLPPIVDHSSLIDITPALGYVTWKSMEQPQQVEISDPFMSLSGFQIFKKLIKKTLIQTKLLKASLWLNKTCRRIFSQTRLFFEMMPQVLWARLKSGQSPTVCVMWGLSSLGGTETQVLYLMKEISNHVPTARLIILDEIKEGKSNPIANELKSHGLEILNFKHFRLRDGSFERFMSDLALKVLGAKIVVHINAPSLYFSPNQKIPSRKLISYETGSPTQGSLWYASLNTHLEQVDHVISVSKHGVDKFREIFGYTGTATVINSLIDPLPIPTSPVIKNDKTFNVLYFGRYSKMKGLEYLVMAFSNLLKDSPRATLTIVGDENHEVLRPLLKNLKIEEATQLLGPLSKQDMSRRVYDADLVCLPSLTEGLPCSLLEAMSIGKPIVATTVGGIPELVENEITGLLVPPKDVVALTEALIRLSKNRDLCQSMGQQGKLKFQREHDKDKQLKKYIETITFYSQKSAYDFL